jgi:hypothetical protein
MLIARLLPVREKSVSEGSAAHQKPVIPDAEQSEAIRNPAINVSARNWIPGSRFQRAPE